MLKVKVGLHSWNLPGRNAEKHEGPQDCRHLCRDLNREHTKIQVKMSNATNIHKNLINYQQYLKQTQHFGSYLLPSSVFFT